MKTDLLRHRRKRHFTINGLHFRTGARVTLDGTPCTNVVVRSQYQITCNALIYRTGRVNVMVTHPDESGVPANFPFEILAPIPIRPAPIPAVVFPHAQIIFIDPDFIHANQISAINMRMSKFSVGFKEGQTLFKLLSVGLAS